MSSGVNISKKTPVQTGQVLAEKYLVERVLGVGGMGVVVQATHLELQQRVAVKFMLPEVAADSKSVGRFLREARAAARLHSHHVARVMDVGRLETGEPYLVMEYLEGADLSAVLDSTGRMEVSRAVDWLLQACEAIAEAHSVGIVHRDLKPSNLFVIWRPDGDAFVKVLDFGISKLLKRAKYQDETSTMTSPWAILGSPAYMSPEQLRSSRDVDHRSDVWSLGIILFELLTGKHAFQADSLPGIIAAISSDPAPSVRRLNPNVPQAIEDLIHRALEKEPERRLPDLAEFALGLAPFGSPESTISARRIVRVLRKAGMTAKPSTAPSRSDGAPDLPSLFEGSDGADVDEVDEEADTVHAPMLQPKLEDEVEVVQTNSPLHVSARANNARKWPLLISGMVALTVLSGVTTFKLLGAAPKSSDAPAAEPTTSMSSSELALPPAGESIGVEQPPVTAETAGSGAIERPSPPRTTSSSVHPGSASSAAPTIGFLNVVCVPACSMVQVDGAELGPSPVLKTELVAGLRQVVAITPSGLRRSFQVRISSGVTTARRVVFGETVDNNPYRAVTAAPRPEPATDEEDRFDNPYGAGSSDRPSESKPPGVPTELGTGDTMYLPENPF